MDSSRGIEGVIMIIGITSSQITISSTTTPGISNVSKSEMWGVWYINWRVTNNDGSSATIYSDLNNVTPTTNRGTVSSSGSVDISFEESGTGQFGVIYARAQASGKNMSAVQSIAY
jgi:hypothetical protein